MATHICPHCGNTQSSKQYFAEYMGEDTTALHAEIAKIESQIESLNERRGRLLRRLNELQSPLSVLPPETLSIVFQHTCPILDFGSTRPLCKSLPVISLSVMNRRGVRNLDSPINLAAVSSHWRQVAHSTPILWNSVVLSIFPDNVQSKASLLQLYLHNCGALPFSLEVDLRWHQRITYSGVERYLPDFQGTGPPLEIIRRLIMEEYAGKLSVLWINCPPPEWLVDVPSTFTRLKRLDVGWLPDSSGEVPRGDISSLNIPSLTQLRLNRVGTSVNLLWANMTVIDLIYIPMDKCVELLVRCPNLIQFRSRDVALGHHATGPLTDPWLADYITLEHLTTLEWTATPDQWNTAMLQYLRLPALRNLIWSGNHDDNFRDHLQGFFHEMPSLIRLELTNYHALRSIPYMIEDMFWSLAHVETLVLFRCDEIFVSRVLYALGPEHLDRDPLLPSVTVLKLRDCFGIRSFGVLDGMLYRGLLTLLHVRKDFFPMLPFHLDISPSIEWEDDMQDYIANLRASEGYDFEIIEDHVQVDWMELVSEDEDGDGDEEGEDDIVVD